MSDLIAFLSARLDEDEQLARDAAAAEAWAHADGYDWVVWHAEYEGISVSSGVEDDGWYATPTTRHIARHDPARVLREVAVKRELLAASRGTSPGGGEHEAYQYAVTVLAAVYVSHPDYDPAWSA